MGNSTKGCCQAEVREDKPPLLQQQSTSTSGGCCRQAEVKEDKLREDAPSPATNALELKSDKPSVQYSPRASSAENSPVRPRVSQARGYTVQDGCCAAPELKEDVPPFKDGASPIEGEVRPRADSDASPPSQTDALTDSYVLGRGKCSDMFVGKQRSRRSKTTTEDGHKLARCRMRIIAVNDVYLLENFPRLKTLIDKESRGFPPGNVISTLAGDFLAPSLLSSIDAGFSMVKVMNATPINMVCFGNHDGNDIPYAKLVHRIAEFDGQWLNSNMPDFVPTLPESVVWELADENGSRCARKVGFLGFLLGGGKYKAMYHEDAFGGAHKGIVPVMEAVRGAVHRCHERYADLDEVIPLTHQDMPQDVEMAEMGIFPVIVGGHDHHQMYEVHKDAHGFECHIVKAGQDAIQAAIIDLEWAPDPFCSPKVTVAFRDVADYAPNPSLVELVEKVQRPVRELESATLVELLPGEILTSVNARFQDVSLARMLASAVRACLLCDAAIINSGTIRGNKEYRKCISYGDLKVECPFASAIVVVQMPFQVLRDAVRWSRRPWWESKEPQEAKSALQVDNGMKLDDHYPVTICNGPPSEEVLYNVACDTYVLRRNEVLNRYCHDHPDRVPPADSGRPLVPILVEFFLTNMWRRLIKVACQSTMSRATVRQFEMTHSSSLCLRIFEFLDDDRDGKIDAHDLKTAVVTALGSTLSSAIIVEQMLQMIDADGKGAVSECDLREAVRKLYSDGGKASPRGGRNIMDASPRSNYSGNHMRARSSKTSAEDGEYAFISTSSRNLA